MDKVVLARFHRETSNRLQHFESLVREGKCVEESLEFARYVFWSGICELLEQNKDSDAVFFVDGASVRKAAKELQFNAQQWFLEKNRLPQIPISEMADINRKLDFLLARNGPSLRLVDSKEAVTQHHSIC